MLIKYNNCLICYDSYNSQLFIGENLIYSQFKMPQYYFYYNNEQIKLTVYMYPYISIMNCTDIISKNTFVESNNYPHILKYLTPW